MKVVRPQVGSLRPTLGEKLFRSHVVEPMDPRGLHEVLEPWSPGGLQGLQGPRNPAELLGLQVTKVLYKSQLFPL
jgi:hypothetical protein